jgi:hypothetical protein
MKTKITILIGSVALITLSFTFATADTSSQPITPNAISSDSAPVGGLVADEIVK